ncbi:MAG: flagellar motor switch phosphatase FliY [Bacillota bacterium]
MADKLLMQEEIDALLSMNPEQNPDESQTEVSQAEGSAEASSPAASYDSVFTGEEKDALGEIGNISMGSAATCLSEILNRKVSITYPRVSVSGYDDLVKGFVVPYTAIKVRYTEGLTGSSFLVIKTDDVAIIADLMMGGDGHNPPAELGELELSAVSEAMNQMMGAAATSMADMYKKLISIAPPEATVFSQDEWAGHVDLGVEDPIVVVSFKMTIGELLDTEFMQIKGVSEAKEEVSLLWQGVVPRSKDMPDTPEEAIETQIEDLEGTESPEEQPVLPVGPAPSPKAAPAERTAAVPSNIDQTKLDLILDIPLKVTVVLGRTRRPIKDVLALGPGNIVELATLADEPVEVLVNGTLVARGEVVVVNENFGVQITSIITPQERLLYLSSKS